MASATSRAPQWLSREQAEAAFLNAARGGQRAPRREQVSALSDAELTRVTRRLLRLRGECGCTAGAWCLVGALVGMPVIAVVHGASSLMGTGVLALICAAAVAVAAVVGKVTAIAVYRMRWRLERNRVLRQLAERGDDLDVVVR